MKEYLKPIIDDEEIIIEDICVSSNETDITLTLPETSNILSVF